MVKYWGYLSLLPTKIGFMDRLRQINHLLAEFVRVFWHPLRNNLYRGAKNSCQHYQPGQPDHQQANIYVMIKHV